MQKTMTRIPMLFAAALWLTSCPLLNAAGWRFSVDVGDFEAPISDTVFLPRTTVVWLTATRQSASLWGIGGELAWLLPKEEAIVNRGFFGNRPEPTYATTGLFVGPALEARVDKRFFGFLLRSAAGITYLSQTQENLASFGPPQTQDSDHKTHYDPTLVFSAGATIKLPESLFIKFELKSLSFLRNGEYLSYDGFDALKHQNSGVDHVLLPLIGIGFSF
jgi:hypothetical protein